MRRVVAMVAAVVALAGCQTWSPAGDPSVAGPPSAGARSSDPPSPDPRSSDPSVPGGAPGSPAPETPGPTTPAFTFDFPTLDGSTALIPLGSLLLQRLADVPKEQADNVAFTTTPNAYDTLACAGQTESGAVVLAYAPAQLTAGVLAECDKLEYHAIGRDALVFLTNESNPVTSLTTEQYKGIYTGKITNWQAVGGEPVDIVAFQRADSSASHTLLRESVTGTARLAKAPSAYVKEELGGPVKGLASYDNSAGAICYSTFYYAKQMYARDGVKLLGANGVQPSSETIADGSYPYVSDFYAVIRADEPKDGPARRVVAWLESAAGQQAVVDAGYVGKE